jgi:aldose 1-epimerase
MLGASLRHRGEELLGRIEELAQGTASGSTVGIPLLHPWANRLAGFSYEAAGRVVELEPESPLLQLDGNGLPIHGVPWPRLAWDILEERADGLRAGLDWARDDLLALFPFPHRLDMDVQLSGAALTIRTTLAATKGATVPVSFGYHPYFRLPGVPREHWRVELPAMQRLVLDEKMIPTGEREPFEGYAGELGDRLFDDGFTELPEQPEFILAGGGRRITVTLLEGYPYAQVYAPADREVVCFEPMTAPTNALASGAGLRLVQPGKSLTAAFRIGVEDA